MALAKRPKTIGELDISLKNYDSCRSTVRDSESNIASATTEEFAKTLEIRRHISSWFFTLLPNDRPGCGNKTRKTIVDRGNEFKFQTNQRELQLSKVSRSSWGNRWGYRVADSDKCNFIIRCRETRKITSHIYSLGFCLVCPSHDFVPYPFVGIVSDAFVLNQR